MSSALKDFFKNNETRLGEHYKTTLPFYYNSLRHGIDFFFKTFRTKNYHYQNYAFSFLHPYYREATQVEIKREADFVSREFTDDDNILLSLISLQRFFELFTKSVLETIDSRLVFKVSNAKDFVRLLSDGEDIESKQRIEAGEALARIEILFSEQSNSIKNAETNLPNLKFLKEKYLFFSDSIHIETIKHLNEWRNKLLHGGMVYPNLRAFDYFVSKRIVPIIRLIISTEKDFTQSNASFYLTTLTGIDLLKEIENLNFDLAKLSMFPLKEETSYELVKLGHLKELGRANMKMNLFVRSNKASYEYNYRDPLGRGVRFAVAEKVHSNFVSINDCPCCGKSSLVLYEEIVDDIFEAGVKKSIQWVTCYTCSYHIRFNTGDPFSFGLSKNKIFIDRE